MCCWANELLQYLHEYSEANRGVGVNEELDAVDMGRAASKLA